MAPRAHPRVFAVGHFPPPVHGMAVATADFTRRLADRYDVVARDISGDGHQRTVGHLTRRLARTVRAAATIMMSGRRGDSLYLGSDGGPGMLFTAMVLSAARARGLRRFLHHHSSAYVASRSPLMAAVVRLAGPETTHVFSCAGQAATFATRYEAPCRTAVVPIVFVLDEISGTELRSRAPDAPGQGLVLGHLSNLSAPKGLGLVFETLAEGLVRSLNLELVLAGPVPDAQDAAFLQAEVGRVGERARYLGAVSGASKDAFFAAIDVFLFPTRYRHESFGIVAAEAMAREVPVIAYQTGCLDQSWVGEGGLVLTADEDFVSRALQQLETWLRDPASRTRAAKAGSSRVRLHQIEAEQAAQRMVETIGSLGA